MLSVNTDFFRVNTPADTIDPSDGRLSQREAIAMANAVPDDRCATILLSEGLNYEITRTGGGDENGDFDIRRQMTISGLGTAGGPGATLNGGGLDRVFDALANPSGLYDVAFFNLTITGGQALEGAAIRAENGGQVAINFSDIVSNEVGGNVGAVRGGAIFTTGGSLLIENTTLEGNLAEGRDGPSNTDQNPVINGGNGGQARGGAIYAIDADISLRDSIFLENIARGGKGGQGVQTGGNGGVARGGAIYVLSGSFTSESTEFLRNDAIGGTGGDGLQADADRGGGATGGAIFIASGVISASVENSLFVENDARGGAGGRARFSNGAGGYGGTAEGGAIRAANQWLDVVDSRFEANIAKGGRGEGSRSGAAGQGGAAFGGAISIESGATVTIDGALGVDQSVIDQGLAAEDVTLQDLAATTLFVGNQAIGGNGSEKRQTSIVGGSAGAGGNASGGAVHQQGGDGSLTIDQVIIADNMARSGFGGRGNRHQDRDCNGDLCAGQAGGHNGDAFGGGIATNSQLTLTDSLLIRNVAAGGVIPNANRIAAGPGGAGGEGNGQNGGIGGDAYGGGLLTRAQTDISGSSITGNTAFGGIGGTGGFGIGLDNANRGRGGHGGHGGDAFGGGVAHFASSNLEPLTMTSTHIIYNNAIAGAGGQGGWGAQFGVVEEGADSRGGDGGNGGRALGGGVYTNSTTPVLFTLNESILAGNTVAGGDGGVGGNGGIGEIGISEGTGENAVLDGGAGGTGGNGGAALGGGIRVEGPFAIATNSTINENIVSSGWGGRGGHGGSGAIYVDSTPNDENVAERSGDGGNGGHGGLAAGGGISLGSGSLNVTASTVVSNAVISGGGGDGGFGAAALARTGDAGNGGGGGDARGGGLHNGDGQLTVNASTIAENLVTAAAGGFAKQLGQIVSSNQETRDEQSRLEAPFRTPDGLTFARTSLAIYTPAGANIDPRFAQSAFGNQADGLSYIPESTSVLESLGVEIGVGVGLPVAAGGVGFVAGGLLSAAGVGVGAISTATTATAIGSSATVTSISVSSSALVASSAGVASGLALLAIGAAVSAKIVVNLTEGDSFREAVGDALGDAPDIGGVNFGVLFGNPQSGDDPDPDLMPFGPGADGQAGTDGEAVGAGIYGDVAIGRTIVAENLNRERTYSRNVVRETQVFDEGTGEWLQSGSVIIGIDRSAVINIVTQSTTENSYNEVAGGTITSNGENLVGIANTGFNGELTGTSAEPLDPRFQPVFLPHGGTTPTLALRGQSPARGAVQNVAFPTTSQNGFEWEGVADIGAWGGILEQELTGDYDTDGDVDGSDFLAWQRTLGEFVTPYSGADANGNGRVNRPDLGIWEQDFGNTAPISALSAPSALSSGSSDIFQTQVATSANEQGLLAETLLVQKSEPTAQTFDLSGLIISQFISAQVREANTLHGNRQQLIEDRLPYSAEASDESAAQAIDRAFSEDGVGKRNILLDAYTEHPTRETNESIEAAIESLAIDL